MIDPTGILRELRLPQTFVLSTAPEAARAIRERAKVLEDAAVPLLVRALKARDPWVLQHVEWLDRSLQLLIEECLNHWPQNSDASEELQAAVFDATARRRRVQDSLRLIGDGFNAGNTPAGAGLNPQTQAIMEQAGARKADYRARAMAKRATTWRHLSQKQMADRLAAEDVAAGVTPLSTDRIKKALRGLKKPPAVCR